MPDIPGRAPLTALSEASPREKTGAPTLRPPRPSSAWVGCESGAPGPSFSLNVREASHFNTPPWAWLRHQV